MAIGSGIFLIAVGAILAFALNESVDAIDLGMVGWILMAAGALGIIISLIVSGQRRNTTHTQVTEGHVDHHQVRDEPHPEGGPGTTPRA
ncbi:MAG: DUF6458 family protein [Demequina sp.]|uniref:DUF6458 family protein n=1 Tax=Demequina sp. TaxID=2050685 RepID=UPI003A8B9FF9